MFVPEDMVREIPIDRHRPAVKVPTKGTPLQIYTSPPPPRYVGLVVFRLPHHHDSRHTDLYGTHWDLCRQYGPPTTKSKLPPSPLHPPSPFKPTPFVPEPEPAYMPCPEPPLDTMRVVSREWMFGMTPLEKQVQEY